MYAIDTPDTLHGTDPRSSIEALVPASIPAGNKSATLAELAHDARNIVTALGLYCELLEAPGVLTAPFRHYGNELQEVIANSRRMIEKLAALGNREQDTGSTMAPERKLAAGATRRWEPVVSKPIDNLAAELKANHNLLSALAGPRVHVTVDILGGALPVSMAGEDLTRVLVNLVRNAADAMREGGRIRLSLLESFPVPYTDPLLILNIEDNGPGFSSEVLENIFEPGFTTRAPLNATNGKGACKREHHGLGLSITRSIVEAAGGRIHAANRDPLSACFQIQLPVRVA